MSEKYSVGQFVQLTSKEKKELRQPKHGPRKSEVFAWRDNDYGDILFNINDLANAVGSDDIFYMASDQEITLELAEYITKNGGVEQEHLDRLTLKNLRRPVLSVLWDNCPMTTIIDGHHRVLKRVQAGASTFRLVQIPFRAWQPFSYWRSRGEFQPEFEVHFEKIRAPLAETF